MSALDYMERHFWLFVVFLIWYTALISWATWAALGGDLTDVTAPVATIVVSIWAVPAIIFGAIKWLGDFTWKRVERRDALGRKES